MAFGDYLPRMRKERIFGGEDSPRNSLSSFFDEAFADFLEPISSRFASFRPRINVSESEREIKICAELPGMTEEDVEINLSQEGVTIRGEKKEESKNGERSRYYECSYGTFERFIPLNTDINESQAQASFDRGVLNINLPKTEESRSRGKKIAIRSAGKRERTIDMEEGETSKGNSKAQKSSMGNRQNQ